MNQLLDGNVSMCWCRLHLTVGHTEKVWAGEIYTGIHKLQCDAWPGDVRVLPVPHQFLSSTVSLGAVRPPTFWGSGEEIGHLGDI